LSSRALIWRPAFDAVLEKVFEPLAGARFGEKLVSHRDDINLVKVYRHVETANVAVGRLSQDDLQSRRGPIVSAQRSSEVGGASIHPAPTSARISAPARRDNRLHAL
jgi:hypothetical protein